MTNTLDTSEGRPLAETTLTKPNELLVMVPIAGKLSPVSRKLFNALLIVLENYSPAEAPIRTGLKALSELIYKAASMSTKMRQVLIDIGAIDRIVCALLRIRGLDLSGNIMYDVVNLVDTVCVLVRSTRVAEGEEYETDLARQIPTVEPGVVHVSSTPFMMTGEEGVPTSVLLPRDLHVRQPTTVQPIVTLISDLFLCIC